MVPAGSEPVGPPYRIVACCDLRQRKDELQKKKVYLVAYDAERLRKYGAGIGIDALEASNSFLARDCVCSDVVPIRSWYGEVQLNLHPPDTAEGDVLVLLRIIKTSSLKDMQDWHPIGDAVVIKVEPRITREDKKYMQRLREAVGAQPELLATTQQALDRAQDQHKAVLANRAELQSALTSAQSELIASQADLRKLHTELAKVTSDLEGGKDATTQAKIAQKIRSVLNESKQRQQEALNKVAAEEQICHDKMMKDLEVEYKAIDDMNAGLARKKEEAEAQPPTEGGGYEKTALPRAMDRTNAPESHTTADDERKRAQELEKSKKEANQLRIALARSEKEAEAARATASTHEAALAKAKAEAEQHRAALNKARKELEKAGMKEQPRTAAEEKAVADKTTSESAADEKAAADKEVLKMKAQAALEAALEDDDVPDSEKEALKAKAQAALEAALEDDVAYKEKGAAGNAATATAKPAARPSVRQKAKKDLINAVKNGALEKKRP